MMQMLGWALAAGSLALLMARQGYRKGSLSGSGALAAFVVGTIHLSCGLQPGLTLIFFYLSSSKLTRLGCKRKALLEEQHKEGGKRSATQVLANSLSACVYAAAAAVLAARQPTRAGPGHSLLPVLLSGAFLGHYACCCADTWASEVGILSRRPPRLLTTWQHVPPGTNGGVSPAGLACSAAGGVAVSVVFALSGAAACAWGAVPTGGSVCATAVTVLASAGGVEQQGWGAAVVQQLGSWSPAGLLPIAAVGLACGLAGSLLDSLLGATVQYSGVHGATGRVVQAPGPGVRHVCGVPLMSNDGVNALAAACSGALGAWLLAAWTRG